MNRILFICIFFISHLSFGQTYFERLLHIGNNNFLYEGDYLHSVFVLGDGSFIAAGNDKGTSNNKGAFIIKLSSKGDSLWTKFYGFDGVKMIKLLNGNYLLAGIDTSSLYSSTLRVAEIDSNGNIISSHKPIYKSKPTTEYFNTLTQATDSSIVFSIYTNTSNGFVSTLTKLKKDYSLAWQLTDTSFNNAYIRKAMVDEVGNTWLVSSKRLTLYKSQANFMKINTVGEIISFKSIISNRSLNLRDFILVRNNQLLCTGIGNDTVMLGAPEKAMAIKLDSNFKIIWTKYYSPYESWYGDNITNILPCNDGNFALYGSITHKVYSGINYLGSEAAALIKIDSNGKMLWANIYDNGQMYFDNNKGWFDGTIQVARSVVQNSNGDFLLVGGKEFLVDNSNPNRGYQSYIVFTNDSGYIGKNKPVSSVNEVFNQNLIQIYPNPANSKIHIISDGLRIESLELYDNKGLMVLHKEETGEIDVSAFPSGLYVIRCYTFEKIVTLKILINH